MPSNGSEGLERWDGFRPLAVAVRSYLGVGRQQRCWWKDADSFVPPPLTLPCRGSLWLLLRIKAIRGVE